MTKPKSPKKLRVLQIAPEFPPHSLGGGGIMVMNLSQELVNQGHSVTVLSGYYPTTSVIEEPFETNSGDIRVQWLPLIPSPKASFQLNTIMPPNIKAAVKIINFLKANKFDVVHFHGFGHFYCDFASIICRFFGLRYIVTIHGFPKEPLRRGGFLKILFAAYSRTLGYYAIRQASKTIAVSKSLANECQTYVPKQKIAVITNAIDLQGYFECSPNRIAKIRTKYKLDGKRVLLCIGRLSEAKGFQFVIQSINQIQQVIPDAHVVIIGKDDGYGYSKELRRIAKSEGVESAVTFTGGITDEEKVAFLWLADVVIIPSIEEVFGIVALEALATGAPIIASELGGLKEILSTDKYSVLIRSHDPEAIANATIKVLHDKNIASLARASRLIRVEPYRLELMVSKYSSLYLHLGKK